MGIDHVLMLLIGFIGGLLAVRAWIYCDSGKGTLKIDSSNPEKDVYRFDIDKFEDLETKSQIIMKIERNAHISQE